MASILITGGAGFIGTNFVRYWLHERPDVTVRVKLPEGFQRAEFLLEKGAIDMIGDRREMRDKLASLLTLLQKIPAL